MIRVVLPFHLQTLASVGFEVELDVPDPVTQSAVLDVLEARYPNLVGTIRDSKSKERRALLRFFACNQDLTHEPVDAVLPQAVITGQEPFIILGAIAGG